MLFFCSLTVLCKYQIFCPILSKASFAPAYLCGLQPTSEHELVFSYMCSSMSFPFLQLCLSFLTFLPLTFHHHTIQKAPLHLICLYNSRKEHFLSSLLVRSSTIINCTRFLDILQSLQPLGGSSSFIFPNECKAT